MRNQRPKLFVTPGILRFQQWGGKYGGLPGMPQPYPTIATLFTETFPYASGALATVSAGRWANISGGFSVLAGSPGVCYATSTGEAHAADLLTAWDRSKAWTATATITIGAASNAVGFGFETGTTADITTEINSFLNPSIIRTFDGAGGNSGNFSVGSLTGTFNVKVVCSATRLLTVSVNGTQLYTFQLPAVAGTKEAIITITGTANTTNITNLKLTRP